MGVLPELWSAVNCRLGAVEVGAADTATVTTKLPNLATKKLSS